MIADLEFSNLILKYTNGALERIQSFISSSRTSGRSSLMATPMNDVSSSKAGTSFV